MSLKFAIGGGIGLFLALIALKNAGIIVDNQATLVGLGRYQTAYSIISAIRIF